MIELIDVYKSFNHHQVLNGVSLKINTGETRVIIGRSGCGKSVTLKIITGILSPDKGTAIVDGKDVTKLRGKELDQLRFNIGLVFQGGALFDSLTVYENVGFVLREYGSLDEKEIRKRVSESLSLVALEGIEELKPAELSGGMKKRVALARALCMRPKIILYDEPTTGVDPITADAINNLICEVRDKLKVTSIVVTHDMVSAYKVADKISMLYQGKIIEEGTPEEIVSTKNPVVYQFTSGSSQGPITESENLRFGHIE
jgi:phospholipid/cholesterol/gamma-HCH transport system ATP-binding protein